MPVENASVELLGMASPVGPNEPTPAVLLTELSSTAGRPLDAADVALDPNGLGSPDSAELASSVVAREPLSAAAAFHPGSLNPSVDDAAHQVAVSPVDALARGDARASSAQGLSQPEVSPVNLRFRPLASIEPIPL